MKWKSHKLLHSTPHQPPLAILLCKRIALQFMELLCLHCPPYNSIYIRLRRESNDNFHFLYSFIVVVVVIVLRICLYFIIFLSFNICNNNLFVLLMIFIFASSLLVPVYIAIVFFSRGWDIVIIFWGFIFKFCAIYCEILVTE